MIDYTQPLELLPDPLPIEPLRKPFDVTITPPGSKSITCRAYVLAALAEGESKIIRPLRADDTDHLLNALCTLGAEARWDREDVFIKGVAGRFPRGGNLHMGDGGAPTRFMIACACLAKEPVVIDASPRMRERPIAEGVDMLRQLGAKIEYVEEEGRLPVRVVPSEAFDGGDIEIGKTQSSQFISATMLTAPFLSNGLRLRYTDRITSGSYIDLTVQVLQHFEAVVCSRRKWLRSWVPRLFRKDEDVVGGILIQGHPFKVEPDASSAAYFFVAASLVDRAHVQIAGLWWNSSQPDTEVPSSLCRQYAIDGSPELDADYELTGTRFISRIVKDCRNAPDGAIALAVAASMAKGKSRLTGLRTLRVKETDRIAALANELRKIGCTVETGEDWISIEQPASNKGGVVPADRLEPRGAAAAVSTPRGSAGAVPRHPENSVIIETYNDHRMAMAFAVLGLVRPGISIRNPACVKKSYPGFWKDFAKLYAD